MPRVKDALLELAKLISVLKEDGSPDFDWFGDPIGKGSAGLPDRRDHFGKLMQALLDRGPMDSPAYDATHVWETLLDSPAKVGFAWTKEQDLRLGVGAQAQFNVAQQNLAIGALVGLVKVANNKLDHDFGRVDFSGSLPVPPFLKTATIGGTVSPATQALQLAISDTSKSCSIAPLNNVNVGWDFARQAVFALCAWLRSEAAKASPNEVLKRIANHLLPLFGNHGKDNQAIKPFPLFDGHVPASMGTAPDFSPWADSMLANGGKGAMAAIWHLRALITGNESQDMFGGSCYVPLHKISQAVGNIDSQGLLTALEPLALTSIPNGAAYEGVYLGVVWDNANLNSFQLVLRFKSSNKDVSIELLKLAKSGSWGVTAATINFATVSTALGALPANATDYIEVVSSSATEIVIKFGNKISKNLEFTGPFGGTWALALTVKFTSAPRVTFGLGLGPKGAPLFELKLGDPTKLIDFTPPKPSAVLKLFGDAGQPAVMTAIGTMLDEIVGPPFKAPTITTALAMLNAAAATGDLKLDAGPLSAALKSEAGTKLIVEVELKIEGLDPDDELPIHIGGVDVKFTVQVAPSFEIRSLSFALLDMRLGNLDCLGIGGTIGDMLPDLREVKGMDLKLGYSTSSGIELAGQGAIPIQQDIAGFNLSTLRFEFDTDSLDVGLDGQLSMGGVVIAPYGLGLSIPFKGGAPGLRLDGLGLSFDQGGLTMTGMFARIQTDAGDDYLGAAVLGIFDLFELSAIGGYTDISDGKGGTVASLFIFASLEAPLGGPPFCFVTGIAGGFGFNRKLKKVDRISDHPLLKVMKGEAIDTDDMIGSLKKLGEEFQPYLGEWWIAAGIQFTSFAFIQGKLLAVLTVGKSFRMELLGSAAFGLDPVAYFELDFGVMVDAESFVLRADLSPNSYIIHPDIFSLRGSFALGMWYGGEHAGDFVLSIGGFHPYFPVPAHYPQNLDRVGAKCVVFGFVHLEVGAYFALTPRAIMTGASISLWAEFAGIRAGLDVYVDVLIQWDPFYLWGRMGVTVWFEFLGRHEIGVKLEIWTPELGGIATIDLCLVSFDISFGADKDKGPALQFWQFIDSQLKVPASLGSAAIAKVSCFDDGEDAGLLKLDVVWGRAVEMKETDKTGQEGLLSNKPILVGPEFGLRLRSRLPAGPYNSVKPVNKVGTEASVEGAIDLPLCQIPDVDSKLWLKTAGVNLPNVGTDALVGMLPAAQFGEDFESSTANNSREVASDEGKASVRVPLVEGIALHFHPDFQPAAASTWIIKSTEEPSTDAERYPLPLDGAGVAKPSAGRPGIPLRGGLQPLGKSLVMGSRASSLQKMSALAALAKPQALKASTMQLTELPRMQRPAERGGAIVAQGVERVAVPVSPARRAELAVVELEIVGRVGAQAPKVARHLRGAQRLMKMSTSMSKGAMSPAGLLGGDSRKPSMNVAAGQAGRLVPGDARPRGQVVVSGNQTLRLSFVSRYGRSVGDAFIQGAGSMNLPRGTHSVFAFGEGNDSPVLGHAPPLARRVVGVDQDSLLVAISPTNFLARGCSIETNAEMNDRPDPLDISVGAEILKRSTLVQLGFPALPNDASVIIVLRAKSRTPGPVLDRLFWSTLDAELGAPQVLAQPGRVALVFGAKAPQPWTLRAEVARDYEFHGLAACPRNVAASLAALRSDPTWDLVDDRWTPAADLTSTVRLELVR